MRTAADIRAGAGTDGGGARPRTPTVGPQAAPPGPAGREEAREATAAGEAGPAGREAQEAGPGGRQPQELGPGGRQPQELGPGGRETREAGEAGEAGDGEGLLGDVGAVAARMRELGGGLRPRDGVRVFTGVYLSVTDEIGRRVAAGAFADPDVAAVLAALFAGRYLDAVRARRPPACWRPLLRMRAHPGLHPLQFALAGINAHIGHDLPLAVVDTCRRTGCEPPALEGDFDRVGAVLAAIEMRVREELMPGPDLLEAAEPLTHLIGTWSLARARDAAWASARLLWALRDAPRAYAECERRLDAAVALVGRLLLTPVGD